MVRYDEACEARKRLRVKSDLELWHKFVGFAGWLLLVAKGEEQHLYSQCIHYSYDDDAFEEYCNSLDADKLRKVISTFKDNKGTRHKVRADFHANNECWKCLSPDTIIAGHYQPIGNYIVGQTCLGISGNVSIKSTFERSYRGEVYRIKATGALPIEITPEHSVLVVSRNWKGAYQKRLINGGQQPNLTKPYWKRAEEIKELRPKRNGDYLVLPILRGSIKTSEIDLSVFTNPHGVEVAQGRKKPLIFPVNMETAWLLGIYVAEGCTGAPGVLIFGLNKTEKEIANRIRLIGKNLGYAPSSSEKRTALVTIIASRILARAFSVWCGKGAENKHIPQFILYHENPEILRAFIEGYWLGDGGRGPSYSSLAAVTVSKILALQLQFGLARLRIFARIQKTVPPPLAVIEGRVVKQHHRYTVIYQPNGKTHGPILLHDKILLPVRRIEKVPYDGEVYNLETSDSTYLANNLAVHNCKFFKPTPTSIARKRTKVPKEAA